MAKAKKIESTLTLEEKLAQALVPESEQPYKVPKNWCWVKGINLFEPIQTKKPMGEYFKYIDIESIDNKTQMVVEPKNLLVCKAPSRASRGLKFGDTVFSMVRPYLRNIAFINEYLSDAIASTGFYVCRPNKALFDRYLYWMMTSDYVVEGLNKFMKGDNSPSICRDDIEQFAYPLAPFSEQQRIVERIESLFARLDEAKEKLQEALESFETRKAAILHKAFTGELTAKWREEHGVSLDSWEKKKLGECGVLERGKSKHRPRNDERLFGGRYPFIQTGDIASADVYVTEHKQTLSDFGLQQSKLFTVGTLCITIAANIGDVAILSYDCCFPDSVVGFTPNEDVSSKFIYYMMSVLQKEIEDNAPATAQKNINLKILNDIVVIKPSIEEQNIIVNMVDEFFEKEKTIKECTVNCLDNVDEMKKAILARAFRGELGTNDENDECAVELLKRVL